MWRVAIQYYNKLPTLKVISYVGLYYVVGSAISMVNLHAAFKAAHAQMNYMHLSELTELTKLSHIHVATR